MFSIGFPRARRYDNQYAVKNIQALAAYHIDGAVDWRRAPYIS